MRWFWLLLDSFRSLRTNLLRSALSILGVIFGVASVVAMLAVGMGAEKEVETLMNSLGADNIHIIAHPLTADDWSRVLSSSYGLAERDISLLESLEPKALVTAFSKWNITDSNFVLPLPSVPAYAYTSTFPQVFSLPLAAGRFFTRYEADLGAPVVVLGDQIARAFIGDIPAQAIGKLVRLNRSWFRVIGVTAPSTISAPSNKANKNPETKSVGTQGSDLKLPDPTNSFIVSFHAAKARIGPMPTIGRLERIVVKLPGNIDAILEKQRIEKALNVLHRQTKTYDVAAAVEIIEQRRAASRLFSYFLLTTAMISLVVGGIGIANVMLATLAERIREVGLRRAIGAKRRDIMFQFMSESLSICLVGGLIGSLVGIAASSAAGFFTGWTLIVPWWGIVVALLVSTVTGMTAGIYPALKASRISPVRALHGNA